MTTARCCEHAISGLFDLDLKVRRGEVLGFLGPNGAAPRYCPPVSDPRAPLQSCPWEHLARGGRGPTAT